MGPAKKSRRILAILFVINLSIPLLGVWYYVKESQAKTSLCRIDLANVISWQDVSREPCLLEGFVVPDQQPLKIGNYEYLRVTRVADLTSEFATADREFVGPVLDPPHIIISRRASVGLSILELLEGGKIDGRFSTKHAIKGKKGQVLEQAFPGFDPSNCLVFDEGSDSLTQIVWFFGTMSLFGTVLYVAFFARLRVEYQKGRNRRDRIRCEIELQSALSRYDQLRYTP